MNGFLFWLAKERESYPDLMAQLDTIYISSSDDDSDLEEIESPIPNYRNLPGWATGESNAGGWISDERCPVINFSVSP